MWELLAHYGVPLLEFMKHYGAPLLIVGGLGYNCFIRVRAIIRQENTDEQKRAGKRNN